MEFIMETAVTGAVKEGDNYKVTVKNNKSGETKDVCLNHRLYKSL
jgi:hypothetical protein